MNTFARVATALLERLSQHRRVRTDRTRGYGRTAGPLLIVCLALLFCGRANRAVADHPSSCKPASGATAECTDVSITPYTYFNPGCGQMPKFDNEGAAIAAWEAIHEDDYNECPGSIYEPQDAFRITSITDASDPNLSQSYGYDLPESICGKAYMCHGALSSNPA